MNGDTCGNPVKQLGFQCPQRLIRRPNAAATMQIFRRPGRNGEKILACPTRIQSKDADIYSTLQCYARVPTGPSLYTSPAP